MMKNQNTQETASKMIVDVFRKSNAYTEATAIPVDSFKNIKLSSEIIGYTIGNFMKENIVIQTEDNKFYFSNENYEKLKKKVGAGYSILLIIPIVVMLIFWFILNYDKVMRFFNKLF
ncbi:MAG: hypothetical protein GX675_03935 [Erysipelotrichaceae bacterium]|nr:hypothetical protein [Erysipelotrichaceae bacterium]